MTLHIAWKNVRHDDGGRIISQPFHERTEEVRRGRRGAVRQLGASNAHQAERDMGAGVLLQSLFSVGWVISRWAICCPVDLNHIDLSHFELNHGVKRRGARSAIRAGQGMTAALRVYPSATQILLRCGGCLVSDKTTSGKSTSGSFTGERFYGNVRPAG